MRRMLISARNAREIRVALMQGERLYDLDTESLDGSQCKANIYKGIVARVEGSLEAAFINYGAQRHGFLPLKEIAREYFRSGVKLSDNAEIGIKDAIKEGQEVLVQVEKEERGNKGAALTTFISLAGSFLVLMPNNARASGISRQIEGQDREELKDKFRALKVPEGMGVIIRTAGVDRSLEELESDLAILLERWETIKASYRHSHAPALIHREDDVVVRALRDYMRHDVDEIWIDSQMLLERAKHYLETVRPDMVAKVHFYDNQVPLFCRYRIEQQIESVFNRVVKLPSGGSISIDPTEALISIDVNSARATGGSDIEDTALNTNLEAADEIARQLRIRDIGGLVVIDFIDMASSKNQRAVSQRLKEALSFDRARVKVGFITRFGLLEMSRQRIRADLDSVSQKPCPCCEGRGSIRTVEALASSLIRMIEEEASRATNKNDRDQEFQIIAPLELASYLTNECREVLEEISHQFNVYIRVLPSRWLEMPTYELRRLKSREAATSYYLTEKAVQPAWMNASLAEVTSNIADHRYHAHGGLLGSFDDDEWDNYAAKNSASFNRLNLWQRIKRFFGLVDAPSATRALPAPTAKRNNNKNKAAFNNKSGANSRRQSRDFNASSTKTSGFKDKRGASANLNNVNSSNEKGVQEHYNSNKHTTKNAINVESQGSGAHSAPNKVATSNILDRTISSSARLRNTAGHYPTASANASTSEAPETYDINAVKVNQMVNKPAAPKASSRVTSKVVNTIDVAADDTFAAAAASKATSDRAPSTKVVAESSTKVVAGPAPQTTIPAPQTTPVLSEPPKGTENAASAKKRAFEHLGPVEMDKPASQDEASAKVASAATPKTKDSNHIALFRSGLLGPVATTVEVPLDLDDLAKIPNQVPDDQNN